MKNLIIRALTGIVVVGIIVGSILSGPYWFLLTFSFLTFSVLMEYYNLANTSKEVNIRKGIHSLGGTSLFVCAFLEASHLTSNWIFCIYMVYLIAMFISRLYTRQANPLRELAHILMGQIYIAAPMALINSIAFHTMKYPLGTVLQDYCPIFPLSLFLFIWINDTGAYLTGITSCALCKTHKLFPSVSPKKTWEGFWGGAIFCMLLGLGLYYVTFWNWLNIDIHDGVRLTRLEWMGLGLTVSVFATFGDLIESFFKRTVGVKDSGTLLPGHGGMWDRFDSLIMAAPAMFLYLVIMAL